ncbi:MAG TPA: OmpA family protein, partial [Blastocatellia bacterium]|nr:OmpA family protein [Blastocatellia bacterium]
GIKDESELEALKREVESITLDFATGSAEITPDQDELLNRVASGVRRLNEFSQATGKTIRLEISGFADSTGTDELNMRLSQERAERALSALASKGVNASEVTAKGMGVRAASSGDASTQGARSYRSVTFKVILPDFTGGN